MAAVAVCTNICACRQGGQQKTEDKAEVKGKTLDDAAKISNADIAEELALPPVKIHCSILAEDAIKAAIDDYKSKQKKA